MVCTNSILLFDPYTITLHPILALSSSHHSMLLLYYVLLFQSRHWMSVSKPHAIAGEVCGFFTWLWVFYRAKHDLPVVLGLRHPWEHGSDPWAIHYHVEGEHALEEEWDSFAEKSSRPGEADDEDDDDDEEDEEDDEEGDAGDDEDDDE